MSDYLTVAIFAALRRILPSPDWDGHLLRKDYPVNMPHPPYR